MLQKYYIPDYVHFACEHDSVVFMNLRSDEYSMFIGAKAHAFRSLLSRTQDSYERVIRVDDSGSISAYQLVVQELIDSHLLTEQDDDVGAPIPARIALPESRLLEPFDTERPNLSLRDVWQFFASCLIAKFRLACTSIERTVRVVENRNRLGRSNSPFDFAEARRLLRLYNRLRPLIPKDFLCLYDSVAILEFLSRYNCYPSWIFAVRLEPWAAHCWVQYEQVALNQDVDEARSFLPLLSI